MKKVIPMILVCAIFTGCATTKKKESYKEGVDDGYKLGTSDAIKREYWLKQAMEKPKPSSNSPADGKTVYYTIDGPGEGSDERKLVPHKVTVAIKE